MPDPHSEPSGCAIRLATEADAEAIQAIYTPIVAATVISFETEPPPVDEVRRRIAATLERYPWLVCAAGQTVLGYAYAGPHQARAAYQWAVDLSIYVAETRRGRGIGKALFAVLLEILRRQGFYAAYAGIALPNPASVGICEAFGFQPIGVFRAVGYKLGAWHDVGWWQLDLRPRGEAPAPPLPIKAVRGLSDWEELLADGLRHLRL